MDGHPSRLPARSRVQVCRAPASARIFWACLPRAAPLTWNPSPLSSRLTRFLSCSTMSGSPGTTSRRSSRLTALVWWKSFSVSPLCSLRTLSSLHSSGDQLAPRQPRSVTTMVPCLSNDMPTAGGSWTRTSCGKLAPGNHPADTPSGFTVLTGAFGSSSSSPYSLRRTQSHGFKWRLLEKNGSFPGSPEKATATHSSPLAWKLPWAEEPGRPPSTGSGRVEHDRATSLSLFPSTHWRRPWQPTPVFSPGESQGRGEPGGLPSMGSHRVGHDGSDLTAAAAAATGSPQKDLETSLGGERMDPANHLTSG